MRKRQNAFILSQKTRRGISALEMMIASFVLSLIMIIGINVMIISIRTLNQGMQSTTAENKAQNTVRYIAQRLREATSVTLDSDGMGLTFYLPAKNSNGSYATPLTASTTANRIYYSNGVIYEKIGSANPRILMKNAINTDPNKTGTFKMFTASSSGVIRMINVLVVSRVTSSGTNALTTTVRQREAVYLRNIPTITR